GQQLFRRGRRKTVDEGCPDAFTHDESLFVITVALAQASSFDAACPEMLATCRQRAKAYHITNEQKCKTFPEFFYTHWTTA
ncbi:hypothetical protein QCD79_31170, partial [Pseudomonas quasicaspiana]|nr:hypothetical protein [Pseudomonas quasicaspiana]